MKIIISLVGGLILVGGFFYYFNQASLIPTPASRDVYPLETVANPEPVSVNTQTAAPVQIAQFTNEDHAFGFKYRIKPYGYSTFENTFEYNSDARILFSLTLMRSEQYNQMMADKAKGDYYGGPPAIVVQVFAAAGVTDLNAWLLENVNFTNCEAGAILATTVAGRDASSCLWEGMHSGITVGLLYNDKIYLLNGDRDQSEAEAGFSSMNDFEGLVASFELN